MISAPSFCAVECEDILEHEACSSSVDMISDQVKHHISLQNFTQTNMSKLETINHTMCPSL